MQSPLRKVEKLSSTSISYKAQPTSQMSLWNRQLHWRRTMLWFLQCQILPCPFEPHLPPHITMALLAPAASSSRTYAPDLHRILHHCHVRFAFGRGVDGQLSRWNHKALAQRQPHPFPQGVGEPAKQHTENRVRTND